MLKWLIVVMMSFSSICFSQQKGKASYYGKQHHGRKTASGEVFNMNNLTCASNTFRLGSVLRVTNLENGKSVEVRCNDTGGFGKYGRIIDLSQAAFAKIANIKKGIISVLVEKIN